MYKVKSPHSELHTQEGLLNSVFTGSMKLHIGPFFHGQLQIYTGRRYVNQLASMVQSKIGRRLLFELLEASLIIAAYPSRSVDIDGFERAIHVVLAFQAMGYHIKLQHTDGGRVLNHYCSAV